MAVKKLQKFNNYHANYLTKAGYEIEPGEYGDKGSYNAINFKNMSLIKQEFNEMVFKINPIMQKGYDLMSSLEREL